jgi:hypothetical protein
MSLNIASSKGKEGGKTPRRKKGAPKTKPVKVRQMDIDDLGRCPWEGGREGGREGGGDERRGAKEDEHLR